MGVTVIKRVENRTSTTVKLYDTERQNDPDHGAPIGPGETRAVDMAVPWAPEAPDFEAHHLELRVNDQPRYWIWQADNDDGDYVRFATTKAWRKEARHVHGYAGAAPNLAEAVGGAVFEGDAERLGQMFLGERAIVVLNSHFELVPLYPKPPLNITAIKRVENRSSTTVKLLDIADQNVPGHGVPIGPGETRAVDMWVPWAPTESDFYGNRVFPPQEPQHLELQVNDQPRYWIWQADNDDGDYVRFATTKAWRKEATRVRGVPAVGDSPADWVFTGDRTLVVGDTEFELWPTPGLVDSLLDFVKAQVDPYWMCDEKPPDPTPSVPKKSAVAFSMAGHPSDAYKQRQEGARYLYRDSGKRYEFSIGDDGQIDAMHPDGTRTPIDKVFSYSRVRSGEFVTPPPFDLVAAGGGRVFAKAKDSDQFYFATMDHMFIHKRNEYPMEAEFTIPSTYFKLDPEFGQPEANSADLLKHIESIFTDHPASERLPLFSRVLDKQVIDFMIARVEPGMWHPLDFRPPQNVVAVAVGDAIVRLLPLGLAITSLAMSLGPLTLLGMQAAWWTLFKDHVSEALRQDAELASAPPSEIPTYTPVTYCREDGKKIAPPVINYEKVLDIGVGHIHHHQQYESITGGEIQPVLLRDDVASAYRFFNGPVSDGDGYIDGTCNFYALVKLKPTVQRPVAYALLFQDEQSFFTQRWRLVDPDDHAGLEPFALSANLAPNPAGYDWEPDKYWCPFRNGHIDERSRLAVAAQVLLVTGVDPASNVARIYSINFSWSTIDRTWRWRPLPNGTAAEYFEDDAAATEEQIPPDLLDRVYPQTIRLRDDMTIHLKGTRSMTDKSIDPVGRWYQRYLPATNQLVPFEYTHAWKYLPENVFQRADQFSHFGVYDTVDSRTQYYVVEPTSAADADTLAAGGPGPWADDAHQLYVSQWKFRWEEPRLLGVDPFDSPSLFNPGPRLRIVKRGSRWIAMHWDKRDDDLLPFDGPLQDDGSPVPVELKNGESSLWVTLHSHTLVEEPPVVQTVYFWWEPANKPGDPRAVIGFKSPREELVFENVNRVRMAAFDLDPADEAGEVVDLLNIVTEGHFTRTADGSYEYRWTPMVSEQKALKKYASSSGAMKYGTSIWFEDIVGHVSGPEQEISWPPQSKLTIGAPQYVLSPDQT